jgi:Right handed beta helix region
MRTLLVIAVLALTTGAGRTVWVGPNETYKTLGAAVAAAHAGDQIFVRAGTYDNDYAFIRAPVTITGVGGFAHLRASGMIPNGKGIVIVAADTTFTNVEFSGAKVDDQNGAGIRWEAGNLTLRHCWFHDNEDGLLSATIPTGNIVIDASKFEHNGNFSDQRHNLYIGHVASAVVTNSLFYDAVDGSSLKSRAQRNDVQHNRFIDAAHWDTTNYAIDLPDGGVAVVAHNFFHREGTASNRAIVHYGGEVKDPQGSLLVTDNVMQSTRDVTTAILNQSRVTVELSGNTLHNISIPVDVGPGQVANNKIDHERPTTNPTPPPGGPPLAPAPAPAG